MNLTEEIKQLATQSLADQSQFIVDVVASPQKGTGKVLVVIDGDNGVTIDDCTEVSRRLSKLLDEAGWMEDRYLLEVSTPGIDRPLKLVRQYRKNVGRKLKVKLSDRIEEGSLQQVNEDSIVLMQTLGKGKNSEQKMVEISFSDIEKAFVLISFN